MSPPELNVEIRRRDDRLAVLALVGELDIATVHAAANLHDHVPSGAGFVLDLRELTFMDSSGLRTVLALHECCRDRDTALWLVRGPSAVQRVFELSGLDSAFEFVDSPDAIEDVDAAR